MAKYDWHDGKGKVHSRPKKTGGGGTPINNPTIFGSGPSKGYVQAAKNQTPQAPMYQTGPGGAWSTTAPQQENPGITGWLNNANTGAGAARDNTRLDIGTDVTDAGKDYGFTSGGTLDPNGNTAYTSNFAVDPSNPFSKMALLTHSYQQQKAGTTNSYAAGGQLNSGAYLRMKRENQFQNDNSTHQLQQAFQDILKNATRGNRDAGANYNTAVSGNAYNALQMSLGS